MVKEAYSRLDLEPQRAVDFFASKIPEVALHLSSRLNLPTPTIPPDSLSIPFVDNPCSESHTHILPVIFNIGEIIIHNNCTLDVLRKDLIVSTFIAIAHHEPPLHMPYAEALDMLSLRTSKFVFHIFPEQSPRLFLATINLIRIFESNHTIYAWSPAGLIKLLSDRHAWSPNIYDIKPEMLRLIFPNGDKTNVAINDLCRKLFDAPFCWRAQIFSAHVRPSVLTSLHRALFVSIIHTAVSKLLCHPAPPPQQQQQQQQQQVSTQQELIAISSGDDIGEEEEESQPSVPLEMFEQSINSQQELINQQKRFIEAEKIRRKRPHSRHDNDNNRQDNSRNRPGNDRDRQTDVRNVVNSRHRNNDSSYPDDRRSRRDENCRGNPPPSSSSNTHPRRSSEEANTPNPKRRR